MQSTLNASSDPAVPVSLLVAAELQDSLLTVMHDLQRLEGLLNHATDNLLARFGEANAALPAAVVQDNASLLALRSALRDAVTELQFHDMATQLLAHSGRVLQGCAFRLAAETMGGSDDEAPAADAELMPGRPNPVTQSEMQAGSVELF